MKLRLFLMALGTALLISACGSAAPADSGLSADAEEAYFDDQGEYPEDTCSDDYDAYSDDAVTDASSYKDGAYDTYGADGGFTYDDGSTESEEHVHYCFRNDTYLEQHYEKHGIDMGFADADAYEEAACEVINNPDALTKTQDDGDLCCFLEDTGEFAVLSSDGYIRTYFIPDSGLSYFERQ